MNTDGDVLHSRYNRNLLYYDHTIIMSRGRVYGNPPLCLSPLAPSLLSPRRINTLSIKHHYAAAELGYVESSTYEY